LVICIWEGAHAHAHREGLGKNLIINTRTTVPLDMTRDEKESRITSHVVSAVRAARIKTKDPKDEKETEAKASTVIPRRKGKYYFPKFTR